MKTFAEIQTIENTSGVTPKIVIPKKDGSSANPWP